MALPYYSKLLDLSGEFAVVTGASQGVGEGIARRLAAHGAVVSIGHEPKPRGGVNYPANARQVVGDITAAGGQAFASPLDLADPDSIIRFFASVQERGPVTLLVNNAFWWSGKRYAEHTVEDLRQFAAIDFVGPNLLTLLALEHMRRADIPGSVINITSVHQETIRRLHPFYSALKAALAMMTKELAVEYGPYGIRVNNVAPGHIETDPEKVARGRRTRNRYIPLLGLSGLPDDIAKAVVFLASSTASGFITGQTLFADGGERLMGEWVAKIPPGVGPIRRRPRKRKR